MLALHPERLAAGGEQLQPRCLRQQLGQGRRGPEQLLQVVEQEQHALAADVRGEAVSRAQRLRHGGEDEAVVAHRLQGHPENTVGKLLDRFRGRAEARGASCPSRPAR